MQLPAMKWNWKSACNLTSYAPVKEVGRSVMIPLLLLSLLDRLRSFIQYDYSIGLRGLVGSRTASPPALYQIE